MIIGIDGNEANIKARVGINTYAFELINNLAKLQEISKNNHKLIVYLKEKPLPDLPRETQKLRYRILEGKSNWILTKLTPELLKNKDKLDVFFSPSHYAPLFVSIPKVCSIMDLGYLKYSAQFTKKDFWQLKIWSAISIYVSKCVIAISKSTKEDIVRHYPFAKDKIQVTTLGYNKERFNIRISDEDVRRVKTKYSIVSDYVLYLGTLKPSKNIEGLITAFHLLKTMTKKPNSLKNKINNTKLVISGKKGWLYNSIFQRVQDLGIKSEVIFTDFVPEKDKPALIKGAKVFALPSYWEGFGLDVLSSLACGVPVVVSDTGSLPEVVGGSGVLVDPTKPESIAEGLKEILSAGTKKYNRLRALGLMQVHEFSWKTTAQETLKILEKAAI